MSDKVSYTIGRDVIGMHREEALQHLDRVLKRMSQEKLDDFSEPLSIAVVGCCGAGCNFIQRLDSNTLMYVTPIAINTSSKHLDRIDCERKIVVGDDKKDGGGGGPERLPISQLFSVGKEITEKTEKEVKAALQGYNLIVVVVGLGGRGGGISAYLSEMMKDPYTTVIGLTYMPFKEEGSERHEQAEKALKSLMGNMDAVFVYPNDLILEEYGHYKFVEALNRADETYLSLIDRLAEEVTAKNICLTESIFAGTQDGFLAMA